MKLSDHQETLLKRLITEGPLRRWTYPGPTARALINRGLAKWSGDDGYTLAPTPAAFTYRRDHAANP